MTIRKLFLLTILFVRMSISEINAETKDSLWTNSGYAGLKLTQVSFTNWATGGDNAFAFDLQGTYQADYKHNRHVWKNRLELAYGLNKTKGDGLKKTSDKIYLNSNLNFQSQFTRGYDYAISRDISVSEFMSPGYLMTGFGVTWIPNKYFTAVFSPVAWRGTFVLNKRLSDEGAFGVKPGKNLLSELGANLKLESKYEFLKNMTVYSRLDLYSDYLRKPQNVDVNWEVQLNMVINKWFSTTLTTNLVYDDDVLIGLSDGRRVKRVQFKELLGVGLQFNF